MKHFIIYNDNGTLTRSPLFDNLETADQALWHLNNFNPEANGRLATANNEQEADAQLTQTVQP